MGGTTKAAPAASTENEELLRDAPTDGITAVRRRREPDAGASAPRELRERLRVRPAQSIGGGLLPADLGEGAPPKHVEFDDGSRTEPVGGIVEQ